MKALGMAKNAFGGQANLQSAVGNIRIFGPSSFPSWVIKKLGASGMAPPGWNVMILTKELVEGTDALRLILHELGHVFDFYQKNAPLEYYSEWFVYQWGNNCGSKWLGCKSDDSAYPDIWSAQGYIPTGNPTTYGAKSSIDDFADSFAFTVLNINGVAVELEYQVDDFRKESILNLILIFSYTQPSTPPGSPLTR
jgi:hypothetical protein